MTKEQFDEQHQLWKAARATFSPITEPTFYHQQYEGDAGWLDGRKIGSCVVAATLIALSRMNIVTGNPQLLAELETDLVRQSVRNGFFSENGGASFAVVAAIVNAFGLPRGLARNIDEFKAALRAGGTAIAGIGHAQAFVEMDETERLFKHFDPGQTVPEAYLGNLDHPHFAEHIDNTFQYYGTSQVIYPPFYNTDPFNRETFAPYIPYVRYPITISGQYWRRPY